MGGIVRGVAYALVGLAVAFAIARPTHPGWWWLGGVGTVAALALAEWCWGWCRRRYSRFRS